MPKPRKRNRKAAPSNNTTSATSEKKQRQTQDVPFYKKLFIVTFVPDAPSQRVQVTHDKLHWIQGRKVRVHVLATGEFELVCEETVSNTELSAVCKQMADMQNELEKRAEDTKALKKRLQLL